MRARPETRPSTRPVPQESTEAIDEAVEYRRNKQQRLANAVRTTWRLGRAKANGLEPMPPTYYADGTTVEPCLKHRGNILVGEKTVEFPRYSEVRPEHVGRALEFFSSFQMRNLEDLVEDYGVVHVSDLKEWVTFDDLMGKLEHLLYMVEDPFRVGRFMKDYVDTSARMEAEWFAANEIRTDCLRRIRRNHPLMLHFKRFIRESENEAERRAAAAQLVLFELDGANLDEFGQYRYDPNEFLEAMSCRRNLAELAVQWEVVVKSDAENRAFLVRNPDELAGLPASVLEDMSNAAKQRGYPKSTPETGPWMVMHDVAAMVEPIMRHATKREFREFVYASHARIGFRGGAGKGDNTEALDSLLATRLKYANILGFPTFAEYSFTLRMANKKQVYTFLARLRTEGLPPARRELRQLQQFASSQGAEQQLEHHDLEYWRERLMEHRFGLSEDYLRSFFQLPVVLDGLFGLLLRLFGVRAVREEVPAENKYDPHLLLYRLVDDDSGEVLSSMFIDPYGRRWRKKPGFAAEMVRARSRTVPMADNETEAGALKASVVVVCDLLAPSREGQPALLTHREVAKLFHTVGGALRTLLTEQPVGLMADETYMELDARAMPAYFLERWAFDRDTLRAMSRHIETGDSLPDPAIETIILSRTFHRAIGLLRRVSQAQVDLDLHAQFDPKGELSAHDVAKLIEAEFSVLPPRIEDYEVNSWPIQAERACGLYADLWSEALAADAFALFEESGLEDQEVVSTLGRRFRSCVLAPGAGRNPGNALQDFMQRQVSFFTFLRASGIAETGPGSSGDEEEEEEEEEEPSSFDSYEDVYEDDADFVELSPEEQEQEGFVEPPPDGYDGASEQGGGSDDLDGGADNAPEAGR